MIWWYWLIAALIFLLFEMTSPGLFLFLSFCFGALSGVLTSWLGYSLVMQVLIALIVTSVSLLVLTRWVKGQLHRLQKESHTNMFAIVGKRGIIVKEIFSKEFGQVKINGEVWSCRSLHDEPIEGGQEVVVIQVRGAHVLVSKITKSDNKKGKS